MSRNQIKWRYIKDEVVIRGEQDISGNHISNKGRNELVCNRKSNNQIRKCWPKTSNFSILVGKISLSSLDKGKRDIINIEMQEITEKSIK